MVVGNKSIYDSVAEIVVKFLYLSAIDAESGIVLWTQQYNGWEAASVQSGATGLEGAMIAIKWFEGNTLGNIGAIV